MHNWKSFLVLALVVGGLAPGLRAAENVKGNDSASAVPPEAALQGFSLAAGFHAELVAAEPLMANPVAFSIDALGRFYFAETFRFGEGVPDIRGRMHWLNRELASKSVAERLNYTRDFEPRNLPWWTNREDRVTMLWDSDGDGRCDQRSVFAGGFNGMAEGLGSGVLARGGDVFYANIPNLWRLRDLNGDSVADERTSLSFGYGVRYGFLGHDLHGLIVGPDGRLYFTVGDRGAHLKLPNGRELDNSESGAVFRCDLDGSNLEIFHTGLRNPQELAFDNEGNLWTVDNNSDGGDPARVVYLAEGGDSGWRVGWQFLERPILRGAWLGERLCYEEFPGRAAYALPPVSSTVGNGPSGLTFDPGIGLPPEWRGRFFLANFSGNPNSGIYAFKVRPKGAGFELEANDRFWWNFLPTDVDFGYDGCLYASDWINGWGGTGKGRLYRVFQPEQRNAPATLGLKQLIAQGFARLSSPDLMRILAHQDRRVRQEAQFELVSRKATAELMRAATNAPTLAARLHAVWGLGQLGRGGVRADFKALLDDPDAEVRAQVAKVIGDAKADRYARQVEKLLSDAAPRVRYFAALALGKFGERRSVAPVLAMLRAGGDDPWLRHAGVQALAGCASEEQLAALAKDESLAVRLAAVVALRRAGSARLADFLGDSDPRVVAEAARAINDLPVDAALPALAALADECGQFASLKDAGPEQPSPRDAILRRIVNANRRVGGLLAERRLATMMANQTLPESIRREAVTAFDDWTKPDGKDRVSGLWRPLLPRPELDFRQLAGIVRQVLTSDAPARVKSDLFTAAGHRQWRGLTNTAVTVFESAVAPATVRAAALQFLAAVNYRGLDGLLEVARKAEALPLRLAAIRLKAKAEPAEKFVMTCETLLKSGSVSEQQSAFDLLGEISDRAADRLLAKWLDDLLAGKVKAELQLNLLEAAARRSDASVTNRYEKYRAVRERLSEVEQYSECLTGGDAEHGRQIFRESVQASCLRCHKIAGEGGTAGPDLTQVGTRGNRQYILESITYPNARLAAGFENVQVVRHDGTSALGVVKRETADELDLFSLEDGLVTIQKADIKSRTVPLSGMPESTRQALTRRELRDLVEYLSGLK